VIIINQQQRQMANLNVLANQLPAIVAANLVKQLYQFQTVEFVSLKGYTNSQGEEANYLIRVGQTYNSAKTKSIKELKELPFQNLPEEETARQELLNSWSGNVETRRAKGQADAYIYLGRGFKVHNETGCLHFVGIVQNKKVVTEGEPYPKRNSRAKTVTKNRLKKQTTIGKMRNFKISADKLVGINFRGNKLISV
jgi:hypothetical protein